MTERKLISAILTREDITTPLEKGVTETIFNDVASQKAFAWIFRYYVKYRVVPKKERFKRQFPEFRLVKVEDDDPYDDICEEVLGNIRYRFAVEALREISSLLSKDDQTAYEVFVKSGMKLAGISSNGDMARVRDMQKRIDKFEQLIESGASPMGLRFGLPTLDKRTMGMKAGEFWTIAARLGTGKSNFLKNVILTNFLDGNNVLVFSLEESKDLFQRRFDAMLAGLNYDELRELKLSKATVAQWREHAKKIQDFDNEVNIISGVRGLSPDIILSYIERLKPDLVAVDGVHLVRIGSSYSPDWQKITQVMDEIKQMALYTTIPICGVVQSNRASAKEGVSSENISFADAIGQLCDGVIGLWTDAKLEAKKIAMVRLAKNRDGIKGADIACRWNLGGIIQIRELSDREVKELHIFDEEESE